MKTKKIIGLVLAGALFAGVSGMGTYSYFSDKIESPANLTIAMGNLDIEDVSGEDGLLWEIERNDDSDLDTEAFEKDDFNPGDSFANVRPGDVFKRVVKLENTGKLKERVNIKFNEDIKSVVVGTTESGAEVIFSDVFDLVVPEESEFVLGVEESKDLEIKFAVKTTMDNAFNANNGRDDFHEFNLDDLLNDASFVTITAEQVNNK